MEGSDPKRDRVLSTSNQLLTLYYSYHFRFLTHSIVLTIISILDLVGNDNKENSREMNIISVVAVCVYFIEILYVGALHAGYLQTIQSKISERVGSIFKCILCLGEITLQIELIMQQNLSVDIINPLFRIVLILITFIQWEIQPRYRYFSITLTFFYIQLRCIPFEMNQLTNRFAILLLLLVFLQSSSDFIVQVFTVDSNYIIHSSDQEMHLFKDKMTYSQQNNSNNSLHTRQVSRGMTFGGGLFSFFHKKNTLTNSQQSKDNQLNSLSQQKVYQSNHQIQQQQQIQNELLQKYQIKHQSQGNEDQQNPSDPKINDYSQLPLQSQMPQFGYNISDQKGIRKTFNKTHTANFGSPKLGPYGNSCHQHELEEYMCSEEAYNDTNQDLINQQNHRLSNFQQNSIRNQMDGSPQNVITNGNGHKKSSFQTNNYVPNSKEVVYYTDQGSKENESDENSKKKKKKKDQSNNQNSGMNSQNKLPEKEGSLENLQASLLSPDFLMNRKKSKGSRKNDSDYDRQEKQYQSDDQLQTRTIKLAKVPYQNDSSYRLDDIRQQNGTIYQYVNSPESQDRQYIKPGYGQFPSTHMATAFDLSQSPNYVQMSMPNSTQFYFMFFQILPEGILLLGSKQNHVHIQNRNQEKLMNSKGSMSVEKFLSLENRYFNNEGDFMQQMNMKNIINESDSIQKMNSVSNCNISNMTNMLNEEQQYKNQLNQYNSNFQSSTNSSQQHTIYNQLSTQNSNNYNIQSIDESILQKSTMRFTPSQQIYHRQNSINKNSLSPKKEGSPTSIQFKESQADDFVMRQIKNQRSQFNFESGSRENSLSGGQQQSSNQQHHNTEITYSKKRTIGDLYRSLIKEIKQEIENNGSMAKYEAFESQVKMTCCLPNQKKKRNSVSNMKSQFNISQMQMSNNQSSFQSNLKSDVSEQVETTKQYFEVICIPCVIEGGPSVLFVVKDVTHFNQIKLLKLINKNKSKMLSQVAHEFRTPLNCMISMMEIATISNPSSQIAGYLKPALTSAKQLNSMVHDLLDLAQVKAGKFSLNMESFNLHELLQQLVILMSFQAEQKGIQLKEICDSQIPNSIFSDPNRLRQIIINLVGNSLKFTKKGSITIKAQLLINKKIRIMIIDTGIGIKDEDKGKLFQEFGKIGGQEANQLNPNGVGLGLMISHVLARNLGDNEGQNGEGLKVESTFGQGTEFYFDITNNSHQQKWDKSFILKSQMAKSQYFKKSALMSQNIQRDQQQAEKSEKSQKNNKNKTTQNKEKLRPKPIEIEEQMKTFGKIESKKDTNYLDTPTKISSKRDVNKNDLQASIEKQNKNIRSQQNQGNINSPTKVKSQVLFTNNQLIPPPSSHKMNGQVSFTCVDNQNEIQGGQNPTFNSNQKLSKNTINIIHEEDGEYDGDGSAITPQQKIEKAALNEPIISLNDHLLNKIEQIGPKATLQPCVIQINVNDEGINSEGNLTVYIPKKNQNDNLNIDFDNPTQQDQESQILPKKINNLSEMLQTVPKNHVVSNICSNLGDLGLEKKLQNLEDLHDSTSSDEDDEDEEDEDDDEDDFSKESTDNVKININSIEQFLIRNKMNNQNSEPSTSGQTKKIPSEQNREGNIDQSDSQQNTSSKNIEKEKGKKQRTTKRYKTKIKRSASQVEFFDNTHRSVSQSLSASAQQDIEVLTVDDNHFNNVVLKLHIERLTKFKVTCASDGADAVLKLQEQYSKTKNGYGLIFMDLSMPEMDGYQTFIQIQQFCQEKNITQNVVACTGYSDTKEKDKCVEIGMVDYIIKPIEISKLKEVLNIFLDAQFEDN